MSGDSELDDLARHVLDSNIYMTLGTTGPEGRPRLSPVFYTPVDYRDFYWVSSPHSQHSRNIRDHPDVSIVVFDSSAPVGDGQAVYMDAAAAEVPESELGQRCEIAFRRDAGRAFSPDELSGDAPLRLYVARAETWEVHVRGGHPVHGKGVHTRHRVGPWRDG